MGYAASTVDTDDVHPLQDFSTPPGASTPVGSLAGVVRDQDTGAPLAERSSPSRATTAGWTRISLRTRPPTAAIASTECPRVELPDDRGGERIRPRGQPDRPVATRPIVGLAALVVAGVVLAGCGGGGSDGAASDGTASDGTASDGTSSDAPDPQHRGPQGNVAQFIVRSALSHVRVRRSDRAARSAGREPSAQLLRQRRRRCHTWLRGPPRGIHELRPAARHGVVLGAGAARCGRHHVEPSG